MFFPLQRLKIRRELVGQENGSSTVLTGGSLIQILQLNGRAIFLEQPDAGAFDRQYTARCLGDSLSRAVKVSGNDRLVLSQFEQPGLVRFEQTDAPTFLCVEAFFLCDVAAGADHVGSMSLATDGLPQPHFEIEWLPGL